MSEETKVKEFAKNVRKNILDFALSAGASSSHFGGALSSVEIVSCLYSHVMNINKENLLSDQRDRFILSKGHACLVLYSALIEKGFLERSDIKTFEKNNSDLLGHPVINKKKGIEFSNGSLGMGLSLGSGVAVALKKKEIDSKTYVLMGDGECNEGSVWESAMLASSLKLNNLIGIIDNNGFQQTGKNLDILEIKNLAKMWNAFGWQVHEVDGHNINEILKVFDIDNTKPKMIIAKTIKGKGFSFSENNNDWHHKILTKEQYNLALIELDSR